MIRQRPPRAVSYVTGLIGASAWRRLLDAYRAGPPTLGAPHSAPPAPAVRPGAQQR